MKNHLSLISRVTVVALATGGLCCSSVAFGQATADKPNEPGRVGSMAPSGAKPSKAEKAKMEAEKAGKPAAVAAKPTAMTKMGAQDQAFLMEAAKGGMMEVEMGKMAAKQGKSAEVKNIGNMMVADHTKANNELMGLAKTKGVKLPGAPKMAKMSDANFDSAYLTEMAKDHQAMIAAFEKEAKSGADPDAKAWAKKMLPALKSHLKMVQDAQGKVDKKS